MSDAVLERLELRKKRYLHLRDTVSSHLAQEPALRVNRLSLAFDPRHHPILLVGDRPGPGHPKDPAFHHTPFYSTKNCSGWMNKQLEDLGIDEGRLVWINAYDKDGVAEPADLVHCAGATTIISLGGNAEKWLKKNGLEPDIKSYHPQYWKRFRSGEPYPLIELLKKL